MSLSHAPSIITNGLVFAYDQNSIRSYKGPVIQNLANNINITGTGTTTGYNSAGSTQVEEIPGLGSVTTYKNTIQNNYTSFTPNSSNCCPSLHGWGNITVSPSTLYTYLILYKCDSGYTTPNFMYRYEYTSNVGSYVTEGGVHNSTNRVHLGGGWYYAWGTFTTQSTTTWLAHCGTFYYRYSDIADRLTVAKVAIVAGNYSGLHPKYWPNAATTRSNTACVLDLTNNNTITATSLTYASDGTFSFNGTTDYATAPSVPVLNVTSGITMTAWIKPVSLSGSYQGILLRQSSGVYELWMYGNKLMSGLNTGAGTIRRTGTTSIIAGNWYMICWTYDGSTISHYLNGLNTDNFSQTGTITSAANRLFVGYSGYSTEYFNGTIASAQIYNRALSAVEVQQNFNAIRGRYGL